jgi:hypothetical protein
MYLYSYGEAIKISVTQNNYNTLNNVALSISVSVFDSTKAVFCFSL